MTVANEPPHTVKPILVVLVWRGGDRFRRALESIVEAEDYFSRIVLSITAEYDSEDVRIAEEYLALDKGSGLTSRAEVICTGEELPTMKHQEFWINYLQQTGAKPEDWVYWLAYDDQVRASAIGNLVDDTGSWPLTPGSAYFGPWGIRHESADSLWTQQISADDEVWTGMRGSNPTEQNPIDWTTEQLARPTYIQMSGSVVQLGAHLELVRTWPRKKYPMRIELATALTSCVCSVTQFTEPIVMIYGRSNSDRASYGSKARREDFGILVQVIRRTYAQKMNFRRGLAFMKTLAILGLDRLFHRRLPTEEWIIVGKCQGL